MKQSRLARLTLRIKKFRLEEPNCADQTNYFVETLLYKSTQNVVEMYQDLIM